MLLFLLVVLLLLLPFLLLLLLLLLPGARDTGCKTTRIARDPRPRAEPTNNL